MSKSEAWIDGGLGRILGTRDNMLPRPDWPGACVSKNGTRLANNRRSLTAAHLICRLQVQDRQGTN